MPRTQRPKPLYQRGTYRLYRRADRSNLEITWYDEGAKRERSVSARTSDPERGRIELDRLYLASNGQHFCPTCGHKTDGEAAPTLLRAMADYLLKSEGQAGFVHSTKPRLKTVIAYVAETNPDVTVPAITEGWVEGFRKWALAKPTKQGKARTLGGVEGCVLQLAAVINALPGTTAQFKAKSVKKLAQSPIYRADVKMLAAMFRFCLYPEPKGKQRWSDKVAVKTVEGRTNLLRYLRAAVATWSRPDAIYDLKAKGQWYDDAGVLNLNAPGREQTKKFRPTIPVAKQFKPWLDEAITREHYLPVTTIKCSWNAMRKQLGLPTSDKEAGEKLIRRSMATICRKIIGEANWQQGEMMLGHKKTSISDIYAVPDPHNLGLALAATEQVIDEIEKRCPGAFGRLRVVAGARA